jgi:hypothetical protein
LAPLAIALSSAACSSNSRGDSTSTGGTSAGGQSGNTGGTQNNTGGSSGGLTSAGGAHASVCDGVTSNADAFVANLEPGDPHSAWWAYNDGSLTDMAGTGWPNGTGPAEAGGALGTAHALHLSGGQSTSYPPGVGVAYGCIDVNSFDGISFWARTDGVTQDINLLVSIPATQAVDAGGDCTDGAKCYDDFGKAFTVTGEWKQYTATWNELAQAGWGTAATWDGIVIGWNWNFSLTPFDIWIDEIALYTGTPPTTPLPTPAGAGGAGGGAP